MNERTGKFGTFFGCSMFPTCRGTLNARDAALRTIEIEDRSEDETDKLRKRIRSPSVPKVSVDSPITKLSDKCARPEAFSLIRYKIDEFSPEQTAVLDYYDKDVNFVLALPTGAGKTICCEMFMAHSLSIGKKAAYVSPLKALTQEKYDDWTNAFHEWSKKKSIILTGDYVLTAKRSKELEEADIILMTSEMLSSRVRKVNSEKSGFLKEISTIVIDESHLLSTNRGSALECGLMKFTLINPNCRIIFLSATMPNVVDMCGWLTMLNGKKTELINSDKRPVPLEVHWIPYDDGAGVDKNVAKIRKAQSIINEFPDDTFILFVHAKAMGRKLYQELKDYGIESEFHCADLDRDERQRIEKAFRSKELRIVIATSTLAYGLNL
ncbi:MAG: DEAD/DEAH box helicase [Nitrospirae bacterium]|nr:DEAD/DEAH box helicase [Nitrospirota bacterium]